MVERGNAQEIVSVLRVVERVAEVGEFLGQAAVEDLAAHEVVLRVALAVAPGERAVGRLAEAHHDAGAVNRFVVVDRRRVEVPAHGARCVDHGDLRIEGPFKGAAHRIVPDGAGGLRGRRQQIVDEVDAVLVLLGHLEDLRVEHVALLVGRAVRNIRDRRHPELVFFREGFRLPLEETGISHFDRIGVVRIEPPDGNAGVRAKLHVVDVVFDFLAAHLRHDADRGVGDVVAAVLDDGGERRDAVRIHDHFADVALRSVVHGRAARAFGHDGRRRRRCSDRCGDRRYKKRSSAQNRHSVLLTHVCRRSVRLRAAIKKKRARSGICRNADILLRIVRND